MVLTLVVAIIMINNYYYYHSIIPIFSLGYVKFCDRMNNVK